MGRLPTWMLIAGLSLCGCSSGGGGTEPQITSFTATPASLPTGGGTVELAWSVTGATSLSINQGIGAVSLAVTGPSSYTCGALFQAQFAVTNGSCDALTVTSIEVAEVVNSGTCSASAPVSYSPTTAAVPAGETVTVLNLQAGAFCCTPGPTCSVTCNSTSDFGVATSAGLLTADAGYTIDLMDCGNICM